MASLRYNEEAATRLGDVLLAMLNGFISNAQLT